MPRPLRNGGQAPRSAVVLPDYLAPNLRVVFCGTVVAKRSARVRHYYAGPGNEFWDYLYHAGLITVRLSYEDDARIIEFGVGLTDLGKYVSSSTDAGMSKHFDAAAFVDNMAANCPRWIAFNGKTAGEFVAKELGEIRSVERLALGVQPWGIGEIPVFVAPSSSGSNRDASGLEGKSARVDWYRELAGLLPPPARTT